MTGDPASRQIVQWRPEQRDGSAPYQVTIGGLRMDTEYEFTVTPLDRRMNKEREQSQRLEARTKACEWSRRDRAARRRPVLR